MGQVAAALSKPFRNFNVDTRAAKVLARRQRVAEAPPDYPSVAEKLSRFRSEHPEFLEAQKTRDEKLHENLKVVYVESKGDLPKIDRAARPLPLLREPPSETDMGSFETTSDIPVGRASLKNAFAFIGQHQSDKQTYTTTKIAKEYRLDENEVHNVLQYFKIMHLHIPDEMFKKVKGFDKIVQKQMKAISSENKTFRLAQKTEKKEGPETDLSHTKT